MTHTLAGIMPRGITRIDPPAGETIKTQYMHVERTGVDTDGKHLPKGASYRLVILIRHDDECKNGHEIFSITGELFSSAVKTPRGESVMGGCIHEVIADFAPDLAPLLKWHLTSTDGPMHYLANTLHHAGDRDCWGKRKGEVARTEIALQFATNPIKHTFKNGFLRWLKQASAQSASEPFDFEVIRYDHEKRADQNYDFAPKFTFGGYAEKWHECPFDTEQEALDFLRALQTCDPKFIEIPTAWGKGKQRELHHARSSAVWPEATDAELMQEPEQLTQALLDRLPALMAEFRAMVEGLGFQYTGKV
jgi:hypothetical protein